MDSVLIHVCGNDENYQRETYWRRNMSTNHQLRKSRNLRPSPLSSSINSVDGPVLALNPSVIPHLWDRVPNFSAQ